MVKPCQFERTHCRGFPHANLHRDWIGRDFEEFHFEKLLYARAERRIVVAGNLLSLGRRRHQSLVEPRELIDSG